MNPSIHIGYLPLLVLLIIAATACAILAAELHPRWGGMRDIVKAAPPERRVLYGLGGIALLLAANVVMFLIATTSVFTFIMTYENLPQWLADNVFAAIMMIGILGLTTDLLLAWLGRRIFPWQKAAANL